MNDGVQSDKGVKARLAKKLRVGVLFGGQSEEHQVSMMSAKAVMESLAKGPYELVPIAISRDGKWFEGDSALALMGRAIGRPPALFEGQGTLPERQFEPQTAVEVLQPGGMLGGVDVVIPVLHGPLGEDGTVQGLLELVGVPYVGSGVLGSALGMDKVAMKTVLGAHTIPQVAYHGLTRAQWKQDRDAVIAAIEKKLAYPIFVKPANLGSSVGVSKACNVSELATGIDCAEQYDRRLIVEEGVDAREFEVGILGSDPVEASVVGEVEVHGHEFYDYQAKYVDGSTVMTIPADIPTEVAETMRQMAIRAFDALDLAGLARVDFFWERGRGRVLLNEVNTLPGFTPYSMYPVLWEVSGVPYPELLERLIAMALERAGNGTPKKAGAKS